MHAGSAGLLGVRLPDDRITDWLTAFLHVLYHTPLAAAYELPAIMRAHNVLTDGALTTHLTHWAKVMH